VGGAAPLLALKLLLVPALLAAISMAGKRWGPGVAGWLAGFPSLTGPILLFLALERGPEFTTQAAVLLARLPLSTAVSLALSLLTLFAAPRLFPRAQAKWGSRPLPASELLLRMAAGAAMVLGVTAAAEALGSVWTGLLAAFPVMSTVLAVFSHRANGPGFVVALLRSMIGGFYAYIAYCLAVAALLETWGVAATFTAAVAAAVIVQGAARAVVMRLASER